ncbi:hypothetical protein JTB14_020664 [Gonioctena quinquepunctata]|nr:hypothetical protein JTB14_020664 [Gonioctena quinquepunctata]
MRKLTRMSLKLQQIAEDIADLRESLKQKNSNKQAEEELSYELPIDSFETFERMILMLTSLHPQDMGKGPLKVIRRM